MRLGELVPFLRRVGLPPIATTGEADPGVELHGVAYHSERVHPGDVFVAWKGARFDGHAFVEEALRRGAVAAIVDQPLQPSGSGLVLQARDSRAAMAIVAAELAGHPTSQLGVVGVTGTNGKTTTSFLVREVLQVVAPTGLLGTVTIAVGSERRPVRLTTPEAPDLQEMFRDMLSSGDRYCVMEVSSIALAKHRVDAVAFDVAVFTNLTKDHIGPNEHANFDEYRQSKAMLFARVGRPVLGAPCKDLPRGAVINGDDPEGEHMAAALDPGVPLLRYGLGPTVDVQAEDVRIGAAGAQFRIRYPGGRIACALRLPGRFNVYNALAAFCVGLHFGMDAEAIGQAVGRVAGVPGRLEPMDRGQPFAVFVDYAHTPDGLENVLRAARELAQHRVIAVFGCGGDRDRTKRSLMGAIAVRLADRSYLTSDNPRGEDPLAILREIEAGASTTTGGEYRVLPDRREAIGAALGEARSGDVVVIAGKGHETYQIFADRTVHFDDREEAAKVLEDLGYSQRGA